MQKKHKFHVFLYSVCIGDVDSGPDWYKYFLCGVKGALEVIPEECVPSGILAAVWGNIPPNSGLSSSSALVSAAVLLIVHASQVNIFFKYSNLLYFYSLLQKLFYLIILYNYINYIIISYKNIKNYLRQYLKN